MDEGEDGADIEEMVRGCGRGKAETWRGATRLWRVENYLRCFLQEFYKERTLKHLFACVANMIGICAVMLLAVCSCEIRKSGRLLTKLPPVRQPMSNKTSNAHARLGLKVVFSAFAPMCVVASVPMCNVSLRVARARSVSSWFFISLGLVLLCIILKCIRHFFSLSCFHLRLWVTFQDG